MLTGGVSKTKEGTIRFQICIQCLQHQQLQCQILVLPPQTNQLYIVLLCCLPLVSMLILALCTRAGIQYKVHVPCADPESLVHFLQFLVGEGRQNPYKTLSGP